MSAVSRGLRALRVCLACFLTSLRWRHDCFAFVETTRLSHFFKILEWIPKPTEQLTEVLLVCRRSTVFDFGRHNVFESDPACDERHFALPKAHKSRTCAFITIVICPFTHMFHVNCGAAAELFSPTSPRRAAKNLAQSWFPFRRTNIIYQATSVRRSSCTLFLPRKNSEEIQQRVLVRARCKKSVVHPPLLWTIFQTSINRGVSRPTAGAKRSCRFFKPAMFSPNMSSKAESLFLCRPFTCFGPKMRSPPPCSCQDMEL